MRPVPRKTLATLVAEQIRSEILRGHLKASHRLPSEQEMSSAFEVGRLTIREALRILEGQGWIQIRFSNGAYVADPESLADRLTTGRGRQALLDLVELELRQLREEGREIPGSAAADLDRLRAGCTIREIEAFQHSLQVLPQTASFPYVEPDGWDEIRAEATPSPGWPRPAPADLGARVRGALVGRCIGSHIGTPVQGWTADAIEGYLRAAGVYPLTGPIPYDPEIASSGEFSFLSDRGVLARGVAAEWAILTDTVLSLKVLRHHGRAFTTEHVGEEWLASLPYRSLLTAERQAYANLVQGLTPPSTATYLNPWREWLGGTVRADLYGYVCPGDPTAAAELAFRDARLSHTRNGVYAALFVAAAIAASFVTADPREIVAAALAQIPSRSRLSAVVRALLQAREADHDWKRAHQAHLERCRDYHRAHALTNLGRIVIGVLWGGSDAWQTISTAVMCGGDPDCAGAAAGSIAGAAKGADGLPAELVRMVGDVLPTAVLGFHETRIEELVDEITGIALQGGTA